MQRKRAFVLVALALALSACGPDVSSALIGSWEGVSLKQDFRFYSDGRVELLDRRSGIYRGRYRITDGQSLTCEFERFAYPVVRGVKINKSELLLIDPNGHRERYRRAR